MFKWIISPLKSFGKQVAIWALRKEGHALQIMVHNTLEKEGPRAIDRNFDAFQSKFIGIVVGIKFLPKPIKDSICKGVQELGDEAQVKIRESFETGGIEAVDKIFDLLLSVAEEKISTL